MRQKLPRSQLPTIALGPRETALYFYGESAEEMNGLMSEVLATYPVCTGARVVTIDRALAGIAPATSRSP